MEPVAKLFIEELETRMATSPLIVNDGPPDPNAQAYLHADANAPFQVPQITTLALCEETNGPCFIEPL